MVRTSRSLLLSLALACALGAASFAQQSVLQLRDPAQAQDEDFARAVKEWTTRPEFISPLVDHLPKADGIPTPKEILGYHVGAPKKLTYYADIAGYYRALAAKSPRVRVQSIGKTDEGRDYIVVFVSSEANIAALDQYRQYLNQLADPRTINEAQARDIITRGKPVYHLMGGLHSGETGHSEMLMELAYRLAAENSPLIRQVRDNLIVTITPVADPDGRDRYVDWYYRHLVDIDNEQDRVAGAPYWGKYVLHDNNRDINYSQVTMRALLDWYMTWKAPILHELHESIPFLYTYSGQAPQNPNLDPILYGEMPWFANFEMAQMAKYGMPGVWTHAFMDAWSPGYLGSMSYNHNAMMRMYEVFNNGGATTMKRTIAREGGGPGGGGPGGNQTTREWYRPFPPYKEVVWSMRNNVNYAQTGVLSGLQLAAAFPHVVLENFYLKSRNSVEMGKTSPPHGFVIPGGQPDPTRVAFLVNVLRLQGIEIGQAKAELKVKDGTFPAGSFVIKAGQPYWRLAKILLEKQAYPDPSLRTYDDSGWTMGLMAQVEVNEIADKTILDAATTAVTEYKPVGTIAGSGPVLAVAHNGSNNLITLRYRLGAAKVRAAEKSFSLAGRDFPAGSLVVEGGDANRARRAVEELGLVAAAAAAAPNVPAHEVDMPRIAVYSTWGSTQDPGWVRHAFDRFEVPYDLIYKERVRKGNLRTAYDVIVVPSQSRGGKDLVYDIDMKGKPLAYTKTDRFKFLGMYGESEDVRGGMGLEGVIELQKFLNEGGVLITLGAASYFPPEFGVVDDVEASRTSSQFYAPRPIVEAEILKPEHPIFYGYTKTKIPVKYVNGPLLQVAEPARARTTLMRYTGGEPGVLSGLMRNPNEIRQRPAIVDMPVSHGRVLLFATNPIYRWQNWGEFNMVFNALMHYNDTGVERAKTDTAAAR
ncbi:MAG TPA: M14 family zinc carboxypeptidase [Vicinamibacterales bacterium]|nr:M14 family zinc carboxypeptidase [Vicinamibacterales bacterium]